MLCTAKLLIACGALTPGEVLERYEAKRANVIEMAGEVAELDQLDSAEAVMTPLRDSSDDAMAASPMSLVAAVRAGEPDAPVTVALAINHALQDILDRHPEAMIFGEDVARKGGVYGVTRGLLGKTSSARVFDTLLDEQSILGLALGAGVSGLLPIPEIQYLAYLHNAADQIRGEGATLQFFSNRQYRNPMVVRVAGYGYQKGFGGHFHNDNSIAAIRDIPGVVIASPARPDDAAAMLHTCVAAAKAAGVVCIFLEPIALYHTRDLYDDGDDAWLAAYPAGGVPIGRARTYGEGTDLTILTFAQRAADEPAGGPQTGVRRHPRARRRPEMARAAAGQRHDPRGGRHRAGADRRRDPSQRGSQRRRSGRIARQRLHRRRVPSGQCRQLHPARRRGAGGVAVRGHHRGRSDQTGSQRCLIA